LTLPFLAASIILGRSSGWLVSVRERPKGLKDIDPLEDSLTF